MSRNLIPAFYWLRCTHAWSPEYAAPAACTTLQGRFHLSASTYWPPGHAVLSMTFLVGPIVDNWLFVQERCTAACLGYTSWEKQSRFPCRSSFLGCCDFCDGDQASRGLCSASDNNVWIAHMPRAWVYLAAVSG